MVYLVVLPRFLFLFVVLLPALVTVDKLTIARRLRV